MDPFKDISNYKLAIIIIWLHGGQNINRTPICVICISFILPYTTSLIDKLRRVKYRVIQDTCNISNWLFEKFVKYFDFVIIHSYHK